MTLPSLISRTYKTLVFYSIINYPPPSSISPFRTSQLYKGPLYCATLQKIEKSTNQNSENKVILSFVGFLLTHSVRWSFHLWPFYSMLTIKLYINTKYLIIIDERESTRKCSIT